jgi:PrtD family type I secretion system ABC transporter
MWAFIKRFRVYFGYAWVFSFVINLLLLAPALYVLQVFDRVLTSRHLETLVMLTLVTIGALVLMALIEVVRSELLGRAALAVEQELGPRVLAHLLAGVRQPGSVDYPHGLRDLATLRSFLSGPAVLSLFDAPWVLVYLFVILLFHPLMAAVAAVGGALLLVLAIVGERLTRSNLERLQNEGRRATRQVDLGLRNAEALNALGMTSSFSDSWRRISARVLGLQDSVSHASARISAATRFVRQGIQVAMLGTGAWLVLRMDVSPGVMIAATILFGRALAPVETMIAGWRTLVEARSAAARLRQFVESEAAIEAPTRLPAPRGDLQVDRVVYGVRGRERPILRGISFALAQGDSLVILGASAVGKSTLARLLVGLWKPHSGAVRLDGADVSAWPSDLLGPHVGYLPQDVELFPGTVSENIARLRRGDDAAVIAAAQYAGAHELILQLPQGYDTRIGEGGHVLSGGQRQRIALARALYGRPRLIVLDEPDSHLDLDGIQALEATIERLKDDNVTTIVVSHRRSIVTDKVLLMREGSAAFFGTRKDFLAKAVPVAEVASGRATVA